MEGLYDPHWACMDCDDNTYDEYFVVHHWLWAEAVGDPKAGMICVTCLERRLRRRLDRDDFLPCPANDPGWRKTPRLLDRMGRSCDGYVSLVNHERGPVLGTGPLSGGSANRLGRTESRP